MATHDPAHHPAPHAAHDAAHGAHGAHDAHAHGAHAHHVVPGADKAPAFAGLIIGGIALFAIMWGVVALTNAQFEGHGAPAGERPAAAAPQH